MAAHSRGTDEPRDGHVHEPATPTAGDGLFDRILVAVDGDTDGRVTEVAVSLAARHGARVDALSVVRMNASVDHWDVVVERRESAAETALDAVGDAADAETPVAKRLRYGDPAEEISLYAEGNGADLVVVGEPNRTGVRRFFSPTSVTDSVRRSASVPVLAVPAADSAPETAEPAAAPFGGPDSPA